MNKKIEFEANGEKYVLEYNRNSIELMERQGFSVSELSKKPMTMLPLAFEGLFYKNHKYIKKDAVNDFYNKFKDKGQLVEAITEMILECYNSLTEDSDEGNIDWKIVG